MKKSFLSLLLVIVMLFSVLSTGIGAADLSGSVPAATGATLTVSTVYNSADMSVTVKWNAIPNVTGYELWLYNDNPSGTWSNQSLWNWIVVSPSETQYTFDEYYFKEYANGGMNYKVVVEAYQGSTVVATGEKIFQTGIEILNTPTGTLSPNGVFSWSPVPHTTSYRVWLYTSSGQYAASTSGSWSDCKRDLSIYMSVGQSYYVKINAYGKGYRDSDWFTSNTVTVSGNLPYIQGLTWNGYQLKWNALNTAQSYNVILKKYDNEPSSPTYGTYVQKDISHNTWDTSYDFSSFMAYYGAGTYMVTVQAQDNRGITVSNATDSPTVVYGSSTSTFTVSGTVKSFLNSSGEVSLKLRKGNIAKVYGSATVTGNTVKYTISNVPAGTYTMYVYKENHVTRKYRVSVTDSNKTVNVQINPIGDITGDGDVTTLDFARANAHAKGAILLDGYEFSCGDVVGEESEVTTLDAARINAHAKGAVKLW